MAEKTDKQKKLEALNRQINYYILRTIWDIIKGNNSELYELIGFSESTYRKIVETGKKPNEAVIERLHQSIGLEYDFLNGVHRGEIDILYKDWNKLFEYKYIIKEIGQGRYDRNKMPVSEESMREYVKGKKNEIRQELQYQSREVSNGFDLNVMMIVHYLKNGIKMGIDDKAEFSQVASQNKISKLKKSDRLQDLKGVCRILDTVSWDGLESAYRDYLSNAKDGKIATDVKAHSVFFEFKRRLQWCLDMANAVETYQKARIKEKRQ